MRVALVQAGRYPSLPPSLQATAALSHLGNGKLEIKRKSVLMLTLGCNTDSIMEIRSWVCCSQHKAKQPEKRKSFGVKGAGSETVMLES